MRKQTEENSVNPFVGKKFLLYNRITNDSLGPFNWQELVELARSGNLNTENRIADTATPGNWLKVADTPLVFELPLSVEEPRYMPIEKKPFRLSNRSKDYLTLLVIGNLLICCLFFFIAVNPMSLMFLLALMVIYNVALVWVLLFIIPPY
ncbi:MAG: hypothetical protein CVV42_07425 [Candidatus Riflebacteria bacterium HGW-Riflebacteria-2]|jgi:hypothetical protein|nr:MAG: hypothetical protein CVV42_07425 [Candidatus Riflebacteria bacterium HGW-Riflebacteria-2]